MRELGFEGIPARHEIGNIDVVRAFINEKLTQDRYTIKKKVRSSVCSPILFYIHLLSSMDL